MKKLPEQFKKDWVAALRSGEYIQVKDKLKEFVYDLDDADPGPVGFCCLGVACVVNRGEVPFNQDVPDHGMIDEDIMEVFLQDIPPETNEDGSIRKYDQLQLKLAGMNDGGKSFDEIATWIEENL